MSTDPNVPDAGGAPKSLADFWRQYRSKLVPLIVALVTALITSVATYFGVPPRVVTVVTEIVKDAPVFAPAPAEPPPEVAAGIHAHANRKLGLRLDDKADAGDGIRLLWRNGAVPQFPAQSDHFTFTLNLDQNDRFGVCGPTSAHNSLAMTTKYLTGQQKTVSIDDVFDLYRRSGNPNFNPRTGAGDNGVQMSVMMAQLAKGGLAGERVVGYAKLLDRSDASVMAAIHLFGGVLWGVNLQTAQQGQTDAGLWDYAPSPTWGGHAVLAASYDKGSGRVDVATWGRRVGSTPAFRARQLAEVWVPVWPEVVSSGKFFDAGVDVQTLAADYTALTGQPFPVAVPPRPAPGTGVITVDPRTKTVVLPDGWQLAP